MEKPIVLIVGGVDEEFYEILKPYAELKEILSEKLTEEIKNADILVVRGDVKVTREIIDQAPRLRFIARAGSGLDNIDIVHAEQKGIKVINAPDAPVDSVAELTIGLIISLARKIPSLDRHVKSGGWRGTWTTGVELKGKVLGIIGLGRIGVRVAVMAKTFGMQIIAYDPYIPKTKAEQIGVELVDDLSKLLKMSDFVSIHVPLTDETRNMIKSEELSLMKRGAYLVNTSRGAVVDEKALYIALSSRWLGGAALDVFTEEPPSNSPLLKLDNVILTPHIGGSTLEAQRKIAITIAGEILSFIRENWTELYTE
ncbi:hydroxyacid dehydrogenase [Candidatus Bathyarchaeota archaeon]|nr:hydroxyacid dehydrogenase [Candidatus Bathyarchaeota archaeon]MBS7618225.1 hydroxyacid dehydrogenase [Candidatus Bathyarchaeota archaeon]